MTLFAFILSLIVSLISPLAPAPAPVPAPATAALTPYVTPVQLDTFIRNITHPPVTETHTPEYMSEHSVEGN